MITIETLVFNPFQENTYILHDQTKECVIIDPGCYTQNEKDALVKFVSDNGLKPVKLLNTHCHVDHVLGNAFIAQKYGLPLESHKDGQTVLASVSQMGQAFGFSIEEASPNITVFLEDGNTISFGESELLVLHVPGHAPGHLAFVSKQQMFAIVGDVIFNGSIGRTDLPGGDLDVLMTSIKEKLFTLDPATNIYPGHGPSSNISHEMATNPFMM